MLGLPPDWVDAYLKATRGTYRIFSPAMNIAGFGLAMLSTVRTAYPDMSGLKILFVQSRSAQTETVISNSGESWVIYDVGFDDVLAHLTSPSLTAVYDGDRQIPLFELRNPLQWPFAILANRFLYYGFRAQAAVYALWHSELEKVHPARKSQLLFIQSAFVLAHEVAHCRSSSNDVIIAHRDGETLASMVSHIELGFEDSVDSRVERIITQLRNRFPEEHLSSNDLEHIRRYAGSVSDPRTEMIRIADPHDDVGVEAICDIFAAYWTARILTGIYGWEYERSLLACYLAVTNILDWKMLDGYASAGGKEAIWRFLAEYTFRHGVLIRALRAFRVIYLQEQGIQAFDIKNNAQYVSTLVPLLLEADKSFQAALADIHESHFDAVTSMWGDLKSTFGRLVEVAKDLSADPEFINFQSTTALDEWVSRSIRISSGEPESWPPG